MRYVAANQDSYNEVAEVAANQDNYNEVAEVAANLQDNALPMR